MIRGWMFRRHPELASRDPWMVWDKKVEDDDSVMDAVVIVPASYVDAVQALVEALEGFQWSEQWTDERGMHQRCPVCAGGPPEHHPDCAFATALQQYREATGAEP